MSGGGGGNSDDPQPANWLISYADMVTNLMMFFIVMYVFASINKGESVSYQEFLKDVESTFQGSKFEKSSQFLFDADEQKQAEEIRSFTHLQVVNKHVGINISEEKYQIILPVPILFDEGMDSFAPGAEVVLDAVVGVMETFPYPIMIEGHTDNIDSASSKFESNWDLSTARATAVLKYLISKKVDPARLSAAGYGEYKPLFQNDTPENRSLNRRIEINVIRSL